MRNIDNKQHVFMIGAKSLGNYGGYETFVYKLTEYHQNDADIKYHVACKKNGEGSMNLSKFKDIKLLNDHEFELNNAHCFLVDVPQIGSAQAIYYDLMALKKCCEYIEKNSIKNPIIYIMACRIGPFMKYFYKRIHKFNGKVYLNPDGHEWLRAKWSKSVRKYWKYSEKLMVKYSDLVVCDSINIEKYIQDSYKNVKKDNNKLKTTFIAYGAETSKSNLTHTDPLFQSWLSDHKLKEGEYYLVVGRFVPENNYEIMIREFMKSKTCKDFAIITNVNESFLDDLEEKLHFRKDPRIKFVGTVYDQQLLKKIRENAYGYLHGHEVGGTNPSLLEALGSTNVNLLLNVSFNNEVALDSALYWTKEENNLANLIDFCDQLSDSNRLELGNKAKARINDAYSWKLISQKYKNIFCGNRDRK